jgi:hypothetical protein
MNAKVVGSRMKRLVLIAFAVLLPTGAFAGVPQDGPPDIDFQFKVDQAIKKGIASLKGSDVGKGDKHHYKNGNSLILLTYAHAGVKESDPHFEKLLKEALESELEATYGVCLTAMALEEINRVKYQWRIHQCAQFLVDNISSDGQARYGQPTDLGHIPVGTPTGRKNVKTAGGKKKEAEGGPRLDKYGLRIKPKVLRRIPVKQRRQVKSEYDHSNMQYVALGLRACHDAGIVFDPKLINACRNWWIQQQKNAKGPEEILMVDGPQRPSYRGRKGTMAENVMRLKAKARGWTYKGGREVRGSMTVGAVGALCIYDYMMRKDWRQNQAVLDGLQWVAKNFEVKGNPIQGQKPTSKWHYYYLYGLERAGMLFGTETIGTHKWYREGAEYLLASQQGKGWNGTVNTCFAILFLRRATRHLVDVATGHRR